jgi:hypothetical protein
MTFPAVIEHPVGIEAGEDFLRRIGWIFEEQYATKFGAIHMDELDAPGPEHKWLIRNWLSENDLSVIAGASRSGKSFLALNIGVSVASGVDFFGHPVRQMGVVYQAGEGTLGVKKRLRAHRLFHQLDWSDRKKMPFVLLQKSVDIYRDTKNTDALIEEINGHAEEMAFPLGLVTIDTLATATVGADEISGKDMGIVLANVKKIREKTGAAVCLVHHLNAGNERVRGHTSIYANVDQVLLVKRDETTKVRTVILDKQKDEDEGVQLQFELKQVLLDYEEDGKTPITSCICLPLAEREAIRRVEELKGSRLSLSGEFFMKAFFEAERRYGQPVPLDVTVPQGVRQIVLWEDVKRAYCDMSPPDDSPDEMISQEKKDARYFESMKKKTERRREELVVEGVLGSVKIEGRVHCFWTGKPLRAFAQTQPKREERDEGEPVEW